LEVTIESGDAIIDGLDIFTGNMDITVTNDPNVQ
jgi:hypothetical protein